jgi:hypothetical protein
MHLRLAAILGQIFDDGVVAVTVRYELTSPDDMAQLMHLSLARDMTRDATRILNVLAIGTSQMVSGSA